MFSSRLRKTLIGTDRVWEVLPGLAVAIVVMLLATLASRYLGSLFKIWLNVSKSPISTFMIAIVFGMVVRNLIPFPSVFETGFTFSVSKLLRLGIIFLGIRLSIVAMARIGLVAIAAVFVCIASSIAITTIIAGFAYAEDIKGYSDCNVCPGSIHYGPDEARALLGKDGLEALAKLPERDSISIGLDKPLSVRVHGNSLILYIQDFRDESYVQIVTDYFQARQKGTLQAWQPELYVQSGKADGIKRDDTVDEAWVKLNKSNIYQWVMDGTSTVAWDYALKKKLLQVLSMLSE